MEDLNMEIQIAAINESTAPVIDNPSGLVATVGPYLYIILLLFTLMPFIRYINLVSYLLII